MFLLSKHLFIASSRVYWQIRIIFCRFNRIEIIFVEVVVTAFPNIIFNYKELSFHLPKILFLIRNVRTLVKIYCSFLFNFLISIKLDYNSWIHEMKNLSLRQIYDKSWIFVFRTFLYRTLKSRRIKLCKRKTFPL